MYNLDGSPAVVVVEGVPLIGAAGAVEEEATGIEEEVGTTLLLMVVGAGVEAASRRQMMEPTAMSW